MSERGEKGGMDEHTEAAEERSSSKREISLTRQGLSPETEWTKQKDFPSLWKLTQSNQTNDRVQCNHFNDKDKGRKSLTSQA